MVINDFKINITDVTKRGYKPKKKKGANTEIPERTMFSFTLEWRGLIEGQDPLAEDSYIGSKHKGCIFSAMQGYELGWSFAKTLTGRGFQIQPNAPDVGLRNLVLAALMQTRWAKELLVEVAEIKAAIIPDPEKPEEEGLVIT